MFTNQTFQKKNIEILVKFIFWLSNYDEILQIYQILNSCQFPILKIEFLSPICANFTIYSGVITKTNMNAKNTALKLEEKHPKNGVIGKKIKNLRKILQKRRLISSHLIGYNSTN